tara:strand:+ start:55 stop:744 length:690 start_codon:yes stop_codon:yes gene_type:complete
MNSYYPKINKPVSNLKNTIDDFRDGATGSNLSELQEWFEDELFLIKFHKNIKKEQLIYTLLFPEKTQMIQKFFHAPKVISANNKKIDLKSIIKKDEKNILINGRLGQGKSMLLRYLHFLELNMGCTLPIFLELRKIKSGESVIESARKKLNSQGLPASMKLFKFLMSKGHVSLFLDGFDEISLELRESFNSHLTDFFNIYPKVKVVVASRFNTEISPLCQPSCPVGDIA